MSALPPSLLPTKPTKNHNQFQSFSLKSCLSLLEICKFTTEFAQLHARLTKLGFIKNPLALTRLLCYSSISQYANINYAQSIFNFDKNPNTFAYNVMIRGYAQREKPENALSLFYSMLCNANSGPNKLTFPFVLKACSQVRAIEEGKQVHGLVFKHGLSEDLFVQNSLINMYSSCGLIGFACQVFNKIDDLDVVSWNSMISGLVDLGFVEEGKQMFDRMSKRSLVTWNCLIDGYVKVGLLMEARELFDQMVGKNSVSWNTMIDGYVSLGLMEDAKGFFDKMPWEMKDVITFNLMIDGYAREGRHKEILEIFKEMRVAKIKPSRFTMVSVLTACSYLGALEQGEWMQAHIEKNGIDVDSVLGTALVEMFAKCGSIERALSVFKSIEERDVGAWNSIIHKLAAHGHGQEAFAIFSDMLRSNTLLDGIIFLGLLSVCRHLGLVDEGKRFFQLMSEEYGLVPKVEHYGCMVDLLCHADLLEEARDLIDSSHASQMKSSVPMWGALLGASCQLKNIVMGEYAAKHLLQLDPFNGSCYTVLSNLYSAAGLYEKAIEVRNEMKKQGLEKIPGSSSMEIDGLVLDF
jgi:pentatricopeptide repeat protein